MPAALSGILVDTSVWVRFFRFYPSGEGSHLELLLQSRAVRICAPIRVEILSGTRTDGERSRLRGLLRAIPSLELPLDVWDQMEESRFLLARKGRQASLIDLMIACTARHHRMPLWTLDHDFNNIRNVVPFPHYFPEEN